MNKKGFTLVELLAVIALLAILMVIAVPNVISTVNNGKRNDFLSDAKRMIAKAEYLVSASKSDRDYIRGASGRYKVYRFVSLNEKGEFANDADGGSYSDNTYVKVTFSDNKYKYCICVLGSNRIIAKDGVNTCNPTTATDCIDSSELTGISKVREK